MRLIFRVRPFRFMFLRNWYGIRKGEMWITEPFETRIFMLDLGMFTFGYAK